MRKAFAGFEVGPGTVRRPKKPPWPPTFELSPRLEGQLRGLERLDERLAGLELRADAHRRLLREALARNAYATASIEGNPLSLDDVRSLLVKSPTPNNRLEPDEREIINYARILDALPAYAPPTTVDEVRALHRSYFDGVLKRPGSLKTTVNAVVDKDRRLVYVASPASSTPKELQAALRWHAESNVAPVLKTAIFFHEFQSIHPFADGNGRLGRLITTLQFWHAGYRGIRSAFLDYSINQERAAYYEALNAARQGAWDRTPWLEFFLPVLVGAYQSSLRRALLLDRLPKDLNERQVRVAEWFSRITHAEPRRKVKFADVHEAFPAVPDRTLTYDLTRLVDRGVLVREGHLRGTRYWLALKGAGRAQRP